MLETVLVAAASMGVSDVLGTVCVVAEGKGHALVAGVTDAAGDVARVTYMVLGVDAVFRQGFVRSLPVLFAICLTSLVATGLTVKHVNPRSEHLPGPTTEEA